MRRRILLATSVLRIISQFQSAVSYAKYVEQNKASSTSSSPGKSGGANYSSSGAPFSGIVDELRKSVGEVSAMGIKVLPSGWLPPLVDLTEFPSPQ